MGRGEAGNWLQLDLEGTRSNRDAVGAVATIRTGDRRQVRQVAASGGFLSSSSPVLHFGLGDATAVDEVEIRWPSGERQTLAPVAANQRLSIREPTPGETARRE